MSQLEKILLLNSTRRQGIGFSGLEFSFPRYICSLEDQPGASCIHNACPNTESSLGCHWRPETCDSECPEKKLNPQFMKEVGLLYRTSELPFSKKKRLHL